MLFNDTDPGGRPLTVDVTTVPAASSIGLSALVVQPDGSFVATAPGRGHLHVHLQGAQHASRASADPATVTLVFPQGSGLVVNLWRPETPERPSWQITDYRWIIEEDRTFWVDPKCQVNSSPASARLYGRAVPGSAGRGAWL